MKLYASFSDFDRYDTLLTKYALSNDPDFRWCSHNCGSGQIHEQGQSSPLMICGECHQKICFTHGRWHEGLTCSQFDDGEEAIVQRGLKQAQEQADLDVARRLQTEFDQEAHRLTREEEAERGTQRRKRSKDRSREPIEARGS